MKRNPRPLLAVILGTNEIASAVGVHMRRAEWDVVLSYDPFPPVVRRGMAFHDALFGDRRAIENIEGVRTETATEIAAALTNPARLAVTRRSLPELLAIRPIEVLIDARMQKHRTTPDLRGAAHLAVGLGPRFRVGENCDIAVETRPARCGSVVVAGSTDEADGISSQLGGAGPERFVYADRAGRWHAPIEIGAPVACRSMLGHLDGQPVLAPLDGIVRGIVRDGLEVPPRVKLVEIDPRGCDARWSGIDERGRGIAEATVRAIKMKSTRLAMTRSFVSAGPIHMYG